MEVLELKSNTELNGFISSNLQPDEEFKNTCGANMDLLATFLKKTCDFTVGETLKGGSLGKGTAVRGQTDLDVVLFSPKYSSLDDFKRSLPSDIEYLKGEVEKWIHSSPGKVELEGTTGHAVKLRIRADIKKDFIDVDLLPAFDLLKKGFSQVKTALSEECSIFSEKNARVKRKKRGGNKKPKCKKNKAAKIDPGPPKMKAVIDSMSPSKRESSSVCLAPLQIKFVSKQRPNVKDLIRLVKYWRKSVDFEEGSSKKLPTSYVFELLTIHAWQKAGSPATFDTRKGFMAVLKILKDFQNIDASWTDNYNRAHHPDAAVKKPHRPYILDPANPFNDVCERFDGWHLVSTAAHKTIHCPLFGGVTLQKICGTKHGYHWE